MSDWVIERGVSIPPPKAWSDEQKGRGKISPLGLAVKNLQVGESLFTKTIPRDVVRRMLDSRKRRNPGQYVTREMDGGIRVWRIK